MGDELGDFLEKHEVHYLSDINKLPFDIKEKIYSYFIPEKLYQILNVKDYDTLKNKYFLKIFCEPGTDFVKIEIKTDKKQKDWVFLLELADTIYYQLELSLIVICDPNAPFFDVYYDKFGHRNYFATAKRNIEEEIKALQAGLYPHQTRRGLKLFDEVLTILERFCKLTDKHLIETDPLGYASAIFYERKGFGYIDGKKLMIDIDNGFYPDGILYKLLDDKNIFRKKSYWNSVWGRSWAIHDGILKDGMNLEFNDIKMYKPVDRKLNINTFMMKGDAQ
ncbi:conserved hypothetical protein [Deferribacter desulfuricans SSM1]|uniref:Uncharacterized protein n=1 Tax=Deferribacter desulfuricans (strain DSM 14783 / JCM 11476 / NBRC 101012 / SSM1) TaxID=639282 RepID=D3P9Y2_DEFDS|nr:hypothetical protein [Deferribacter desulfuricans]BAI81522.1 conserved hypothetical protein [Deferribacter desulfuricans SSM1]